MENSARKQQNRSANSLKAVELEDVKIPKAAQKREARDLSHYKKHGSSHAEESEGWLVSYADLMTLLFGFFVVLFSFSKIDAGEFEKVKKETTKVFGGEYKKPFEELSKALQQVIEEKKLGDQVFIETDEEGVLITFRGALFFDSGSADMKEQARDLLSQLVPTITKNSQEMGVLIEGHTDNRPIYSKIFASNWELSSVRACTVLRYFLEAGFNPDMIKATGWGDRRPVVPNNDKSGAFIPENQSQNRRVVIKIMKDFE